jgi:hypothetical protein
VEHVPNATSVKGEEEMYKHWLKIDGYWSNEVTQKAYQNLQEYLDLYPEAKITMFLPKYRLFHRYILLECSQNYNDLYLDCNSFFTGSLIRLTSKPKHMVQSRRNFKEHYQAAMAI